MNIQDDIPVGGFEERLLAELKAAVAIQSPRPSPGLGPEPAWAGRARPRGMRLGRRALAGVAAAAAAGGTLTGGLVEHDLSRVAAAPAVTTAALDAFLDKAAAAALKSAASPEWKYVWQGQVERRIQRGPGQPVECQQGINRTPVTGLLDVIYSKPVACDRVVLWQPPTTQVRPAAPSPKVSAAPGTAHRHYPDLSLLPTTPDALRAELYAAADRGPGYWEMTTDDKDAIVFGLITRILESGVDGGPLRAALYRVVEQVPGVSITFGAKDLIGRTGAGITFTEHGPHGLSNTTGFILSSAPSFVVLGTMQAGYDWHVPGPPRYSSFAAAYLRMVEWYAATQSTRPPGH
jgi:hypothetical protein